MCQKIGLGNQYYKNLKKGSDSILNPEVGGEGGGLGQSKVKCNETTKEIWFHVPGIVACYLCIAKAFKIR